MSNRSAVALLALSLTFAQQVEAKDRHTINAAGHALDVVCSQDFNRKGQPKALFLGRMNDFIHKVKGIPAHQQARVVPGYTTPLIREIKAHGGGPMLTAIVQKCAP